MSTKNSTMQSSRKLMSCFALNVDGNILCDKNLNGFAAMNRRYQKVKILNMSANQIEINIVGIKEAGRKATEIKIENCALLESMPLLPCFPNVVKLELGGIFGGSETLSPAAFPRLKHLKLSFGCNVSSDPFRVMSTI